MVRRSCGGDQRRRRDQRAIRGPDLATSNDGYTKAYIAQPAATGEPPKTLDGFAKIGLAPAQTARVAISLDKRSFQYWTSTGWSTAAGKHQILIGASSQNIRLTGTLALPTGR